MARSTTELSRISLEPGRQPRAPRHPGRGQGRWRRLHRRRPPDLRPRTVPRLGPPDLPALRAVGAMIPTYTILLWRGLVCLIFIIGAMYCIRNGIKDLLVNRKKGFLWLFVGIICCEFPIFNLWLGWLDFT